MGNAGKYKDSEIQGATHIGKYTYRKIQDSTVTYKCRKLKGNAHTGKYMVMQGNRHTGKCKTIYGNTNRGNIWKYNYRNIH